MRWWMRGRPEDMEQLLVNGMTPQELADRLELWGFHGLWFDTYVNAHPIWGADWCKIRNDFRGHLEALRKRDFGLTCVVQCLHDPVRFATDISSHPVIVAGAINGSYRPICPTHTGHLAYLAGRVEASRSVVKPEGLVLGSLHGPLDWLNDKTNHATPPGCACNRCLAAYRRGDVGLSALEGVEESILLPKYQCQRLGKKAKPETRFEAWLEWRSSHITQLALDLFDLADESRRVVEIVPPLHADSAVKEIEIRAGQNLGQLVSEGFALSPLLHAPNCRKKEKEKWATACLDSFLDMTPLLIPTLGPSKKENAMSWKDAWTTKLEKRGIEEAVAYSLGSWLRAE